MRATALVPAILASLMAAVAGNAHAQTAGSIRLDATVDPQGRTATQALSRNADSSDQVRQARLLEAYGALPVSFEANRGQTHPDVSFVSRGNGYTIYLTPTGAVMVLSKAMETTAAAVRTGGALPEVRSPAEQAVLRMRLLGADPQARGIGMEVQRGKSHYFIGNDPSAWRTNVLRYAKVRFPNVYPGVDLVYHGNQGQMEYDFVIAPGVDPRVITVAFEGQDRLEINARGDLVLKTEGGEVLLEAPIIYQEIEGDRRVVDGRYVVTAENRVGFAVASFDRSQPLIIDPVLSYSTYLGGSSDDVGSGIAVDGDGAAYVTGSTLSLNFPTTNPHQGVTAGYYDVFITKLDPSGQALVYSTYLGGINLDQGVGIAVDGQGAAYVAGVTASTDFPTTTPYQGANAGGFDAFLAKLDPSGQALEYSTYLGGSNEDQGVGIALDAQGAAYVTGRTLSTNFPTMTPYQGLNIGGRFDAFVTKFDASGQALAYSTYLGGIGDDHGFDIAVDGQGAAYITGSTLSFDFPTVNAYQSAIVGGLSDAFVAKLDPSGQALSYSTYLGGGSEDRGRGIAVDAQGAAYVTGTTASTNFPTTNPYQAANAGNFDVFITKLDPSGQTLAYSTYLGGSSTDRGESIAVDAQGAAHVTGDTRSTNFPTANPYQPVNAGSVDVFITKLDPSGQALDYSTHLGGTSGDYGLAIALDGQGAAYVTGFTTSRNLYTASPYQGMHAGDFDAFVAKTLPIAGSDQLVVHAGHDQTAIEASIVMLSGAPSRDPQGGVLSYQWEQIAGPALAVIVGCPRPTTEHSFTFRAPLVGAAGTTLTFRLTVGNGQATASDTVSVFVADGQYSEQAQILLEPSCDPLVQGYQTEGTAPYSPGFFNFTIFDLSTNDYRSFFRPLPELAPGAGDVAVEFETFVGNPFLDGERSGVTFVLDEGQGGRQIRAEYIERRGARRVALAIEGSLTDGIVADLTTPLRLRLERRGNLAVLTIGAIEHAIPLTSAPLGHRASPGFEFGTLSAAGAGALDIVGPIVAYVPFFGAPVANAGPDQAAQPGALVTLDGSGSHDQGGDPLTYSWVQVAGPAVTLDRTDPVRPKFLAPPVPAGGATLVFELTVHDGLQASLPDTVQIVVNGLVANAGPDRTVQEATAILLPDGFVLPDEVWTYHWEQIAGPAVRLCRPDLQQLAFTTPLVGPSGAALSFQITVSNGQDTAIDSVHVTVADGPHPGNAKILFDPTCDPLSQGYQTEGTAPYAVGARLRIDDASSDRRLFFLPLPEAEVGALALEVDVRLEGSVRPNGEDTGAHFVLNSGASGGTEIRVAAIQRGFFERRVAVMGSNGTTAGIAADWTTALKFRIERDLNGSAIVSFAGQTEIIPSSGLTGARRVQPTFELGMFSGPATATATFGPVVAHASTFGAPIAHAGPDQSVNEGVIVALDGSGSHDPGGDPLTYTWAQVGGPVVTLDLTDPVRPTFVAPPVPPAGTRLTLELTVSDGQYSATDTVSIVVTAQGTVPDTTAPVVSCPANVIAQATSASGAIVNYPAATATDVIDPSPLVTYSQASGTLFPLGMTTVTTTATDAQGNSSTCSFAVTVVEPPVADAGPDRNVLEATAVLMPEAFTPALPGMTYHWVQLAGPAVRLCSPDVKQLAFTTPLVGPSGAALSFQLTVGNGLTTATDTVTVTVADGPHPGNAKILFDPTCDPLSQGYQTEGTTPYAVGARLRIDDASGTDRRLFFLPLPEAEVGALAIDVDVRLEGTPVPDGEDTGAHFVLNTGASVGTEIRVAAIQRGFFERRVAVKDSTGSFTAGIAADWITALKFRIERDLNRSAIVSFAGQTEIIPEFGLTHATRVQPTFELGMFSSRATTTATFGPVVAHASTFGAPIAHAGQDQSVNEGAIVTLDGSGSHDPGGDPLTYTWAQVGGPAMTLNLTDPVRPTFVAPPVPPSGTTRTFELTVSDGQFSATDTVAIVVAPGSSVTLSSITVNPANPTITVGSTQPFTATGTFSDGSTQVLSGGSRVPSGLVSWWSGDGHANDLVGSNHGVLVNGATFAPGMVQQAFSLDGVNDHVRIPDAPGLDFTNVLSVEVWIFPTAFPSASMVMAKWDAVAVNQRSYALVLGSSGNVFFRVSPDGSEPGGLGTVSSNTGVPLNQWTHVAAVYDGSTIGVYINGVLDNQATYNQGIFAGTNDFSIGALVGGVAPGQFNFPFAGLIDELALYNRALTAEELQAIFNAGSVGKCKSPSRCVTWSSSDSVVAVIDASGLAASLAGGQDAGTTTITATSTSVPSISGSTTLTVVRPNQSPVADAGPDRNVPEATAVLLPEAFTPGPPGRTYHWEQIAGSAVRLCSPDVPVLMFTAPLVGPSGATLTFQLTVTHGQASASDTVNVLVADGPYSEQAQILLEPTCDPLAQGYQTAGNAPYNTGFYLTVDDAATDFRSFFHALPELAPGAGDVAIEVETSVAPGSVTLDGERSGVAFVLNEGGGGRQIRVEYIERAGIRRVGLLLETGGVDDGIAIDWTGTLRLRLERRADFGVLTIAGIERAVPLALLALASGTTPTLELGALSGPGRARVSVGPVVGVIAPNQSPVADAGPDQMIEATSPSGASVTLDGTASSDPDGDALTFAWDLDGDGTFETSGATPTVTLPLGLRTVTLRVSDEALATATDTVAITVRDSTSPVMACPANVTADATSSSGAIVVYPAATATDAVDPAPAITYSQASGTQFPVGTTTVTVTATDAAGNSSTCGFTVTVTPLNAAPVAGNQSVSVAEDTATAITLTASDPDGDALTYIIVTPPAHGGLSGTAPSLTYTPSANYNGPDSFTFKANDGSLDSNVATVSFTVTPVNDAPVNSVPGPQGTASNLPLLFSAAGGNAISTSDLDAGTNPVRVTLTATNGTLTLSRITGLSFSAGGGTADATMTATGTIANITAALDGMRFTPRFGFSGAASLTIATNDQGHSGAGGASIDTDTVPITVGPGASADLAITMTDAPDPVVVGSDLAYSIQVTNNGPFQATSVTMLDVLPAGVSFVSATASQGACTFLSVLRTVQCGLGSLANLGTARVTLVVRPTQRRTITNQVVVGANQPDPTTANNTAVVRTVVEAM